VRRAQHRRAASTAATTTTRSSAASACFTTRPRAAYTYHAFFDLEPGVIYALRASPLGENFCAGNLVNHTRGQKWAKGHYRKADANLSDFPLQKRQAPSHPPPPPRPVVWRPFLVNSKSHTGARPLVRLCGRSELSRCVHKSVEFSVRRFGLKLSELR
jgi:hypothetical protein